MQSTSVWVVSLRGFFFVSFGLCAGLIVFFPFFFLVFLGDFWDSVFLALKSPGPQSSKNLVFEWCKPTTFVGIPKWRTGGQERPRQGTTGFWSRCFRLSRVGGLLLVYKSSVTHGRAYHLNIIPYLRCFLPLHVFLVDPSPNCDPHLLSENRGAQAPFCPKYLHFYF